MLNREIKSIAQGINSDRSLAIANYSSLLNKIANLGKKVLIKRRSINNKVLPTNIKQLRSNTHKNAIKSLRENEFFPTSVPGVGEDFDNLLNNIHDLENAAIKEGFNFDQILSAFRKIFYDGKGWDIIIPGAVSVKFPISWKNTSTKQKIVELKKAGEKIQIQGYETAISHLFTGLDALNNKVEPLKLSFHGITVTKISSNRAQATYSGDLGSVVYEYQKARGNTNFRDAAMVKDLPLLQSIYTKKYARDEDMGGNADAYSLVLDKSKSITQNLFEYYTAPHSGIHLRYYNFAKEIMKLGSPEKIKSWVIGDIFASSLAYAVGIKKDKGYVFLIKKDPKPGIWTPTFWEMAYNSASWVAEEFIDRVNLELSKIKTP